MARYKGVFQEACSVFMYPFVYSHVQLHVIM